MQGKKVLTIGCALGILAWGACFAPPPRPPRPRVYPHRVQRIRVTVSDTSEPPVIDSSMFERCMADSINFERRADVPTAVAGGEAKSGDAVFQVVIEKAEGAARPGPGISGSTDWDLHVTLSGALTREDGTVIWRGRSQVYSGFARVPPGGTAWNSPSFAKDARANICAPFVRSMMYR